MTKRLLINKAMQYNSALMFEMEIYDQRRSAIREPNFQVSVVSMPFHDGSMAACLSIALMMYMHET